MAVPPRFRARGRVQVAGLVPERVGAIGTVLDAKSLRVSRGKQQLCLPKESHRLLAVGVSREILERVILG